MPHDCAFCEDPCECFGGRYDCKGCSYCQDDFEAAEEEEYDDDDPEDAA